MPTERDMDIVEIPVTLSPLTPQQMEELSQAVVPTEQCDDLGISLYIRARAFINECIQLVEEEQSLRNHM